ncbi:MAG: hypothetical protein EZS28_039003, partial [Streblomastix strix]
NASITPMMHYLREEIVRIIFFENSKPQVRNIGVMGEHAGGSIKLQ